MCTSFDLNSYYYTNAILQQNQEKLETNLLSRNKALCYSNIVYGKFSPGSIIPTFTGGLHLYM